MRNVAKNQKQIEIGETPLRKCQNYSNYSRNWDSWQIVWCIRVSVKVDSIQLLWYTDFSVIDAMPRRNIVALMEL